MVHTSNYGKHDCLFRKFHYLCIQLWTQKWQNDIVFERVLRSCHGSFVTNNSDVSRRAQPLCLQQFQIWLDSENVNGLPMKIALILMRVHESKLLGSVPVPVQEFLE